MAAIEPNATILIVFSLTWMAFCFGAFVIAGMLPLSTAAPEIRTGPSLFLLGANVFLLICLLGITAIIGYRDLRWTSIVIAGGLIFLLAPFLVQDLPERIKNGQTGLVVVLATTLAGVAVAWLSGVGPAMN